MRAFLRLALCLALAAPCAAEARPVSYSYKAIQGPAGPAGPQGEPGPAGPPGADGAPGAQGERGLRGNAGAKGEQGPSGDPGAKGEPGAAGVPGVAGRDGSAGAPGAKGDTGPQGLPGTKGDKGDTGAAGKDGAQGMPGPIGPKGDTGATGPAGPKVATFVCNATITETVALAVSAGLRLSPEISCAGALATDILEVYPTGLAGLSTTVLGQVVSNGTAVHHAIPTTVGKFRAVVSLPAISLGATYSIPVAVYAVNR